MRGGGVLTSHLDGHSVRTLTVALTGAQRRATPVDEASVDVPALAKPNAWMRHTPQPQEKRP